MISQDIHAIVITRSDEEDETTQPEMAGALRRTFAPVIVGGRKIETHIYDYAGGVSFPAPTITSAAFERDAQEPIEFNLVASVMIGETDVADDLLDPAGWALVSGIADEEDGEVTVSAAGECTITPGPNIEALGEEDTLTVEFTVRARTKAVYGALEDTAVITVEIAGPGSGAAIPEAMIGDGFEDEEELSEFLSHATFGPTPEAYEEEEEE